MSGRISKVFEREISNSVVPGSRVVRSAEVAHVGIRQGNHDHGNHDHAATIELVTEGNIVRAIDVTCACGQKMRLWCSYENSDDQRDTAEAA